MPLMPSNEELRLKYAAIMADPAVTALSNWTQPNEDGPFDDETYLQTIDDNFDDLQEVLDKAIGLIGKE